MYQKPEVQRFGSLRELTLVGCSGDHDPVALFGDGNGFNVTDCPKDSRS